MNIHILGDTEWNIHILYLLSSFPVPQTHAPHFYFWLIMGKPLTSEALGTNEGNTYLNPVLPIFLLGKVAIKEDKW